MIKQDFVETKLSTKFADFTIRVYRDRLNKETLVFSSANIDATKPVLVRVHSECITGDLFGSLHCDCGKQLTKSLQLISEEGGVLIYLRQEGRGIGLFEKIKSYQLQSKGHDTFEANVLLGHKPDLRSYEMVKLILDDLNISRIKLLTNNPSKVSEISKLGVEIVETVPLVSKANKYNKKYLDTKQNKFQHFLKRQAQHYFYQFHVDTADQLESVVGLMQKEKMDPLLKICVGIRADSSTFENPTEVERIDKIIKYCRIHTEFVPIIHFSFTGCSKVFEVVVKIKENWPLANRIQLNDVDKLKVSDVKKILEKVEIDIPLSDQNFEIVHSRRFRSLIKNKNCTIYLDNSKGKGIRESAENFKKKINILLSYGLNNIGLCGGFGPNALESYFDVRRYYRINFSIDAETNIRTNGYYDPTKIKLYLRQLMRFDDPKSEGIEQTKKFLKQIRFQAADVVSMENRDFIIFPQVFHAGHFPSSSWFAKELTALLKNETKFCEVGCGSGIVSCLLALANPSLHITATDINPHASANTKLNAEKHKLSTQISVYQGDVLDGIDSSEKFETIFWALPFGFLDPGAEITMEEAQCFDPGYRAIRKFFKSSAKYLKREGRLLIGFSTDLGHPTLLSEIAKEFSFTIRKICEKVMIEDVPISFEILEAKLEMINP